MIRLALLLALSTSQPLAATPPATLPEAVHLKSRQQSFNRRYQAVLSEGRIYFKANAEKTGLQEDWRPLPLPRHLDGKVVELAVDDTYVIAITPDRTLHTMTGFLEEPSSFKWVPKSRWGSPFWRGRGMKLPAAVRAWDISFNSVPEDRYFVDSAGNKQSLGQGCTTLYALGATGQEITYIDPWLPTDLSYQVCGPRRNAFIAESLSSSGSTIFVVDRYGDMYVRSYDFDIAGADWLFFASTYEDMSRPKVDVGLQPTNLWRIPRKLAGRSVKGVSDRPRQLPAPGWARQEKINGVITDRITVAKEGEGGLWRWLRVEGASDGKTGYFQALARLRERDANGEAVPQRWEFVATGEPLQGRILDNRPEDSTELALGPIDAYGYARGAVQKQKYPWRAEVEGFHPYCSPAPLRIAFTHGEVLGLVLHTRETIRQSTRAPGLNDEPLVLQGAVERPEAIVAEGAGALGPAARWFLREHFEEGRFVPVKVKATTRRLVIKGFAGETVELEAAAPGSGR